MKAIFLSIVAVITFACPCLAACNQATGKAVAAGVTSDFATMAHFTKATCLPTAEPDGCAILCVSDLTIVGENPNLALTMITGSAAKRMSDAGLKQFSKVLFADRNLLQSKQALMLSAEDAVRLRSTFLTSKEQPLDMAARVGRAYKLVDMKK